MEMFKKFAELLSTEITATIVIRHTAGGRMTVITNFSTEKGGVCEGLAPFTLKGTPAELDEGFLGAIAAPAETVSGLVSNIAAFQKSAQQAEKNAKNTSSSKGGTTTASAVKDAVKKADEERKRKEAEANARRENFNKALAEVKTANAHGNYHTAEALLQLAASLTDDKKVKADLEKQMKPIAENKESFLCSDDPETAAKALEAFKAAMVKPAAPAPAPVAEDEQQAGPAAAAEDAEDEENGNEE